MSAEPLSPEQLVASVERFIVLKAYQLAPIFGVDPDDLAQEGRLHAFQCAKRYVPCGASFLTYVGTGLVGKMLRRGPDLADQVHMPVHRRKSGRWKFTSLDARIDPDEETRRSEILDCTPEENIDPAKQYELEEAIQQAIATLNPNQQQVIRWRYEQGLSHQEIADLTGKDRASSYMCEQGALVRLARSPYLKSLRRGAR